jgi:hypothetical protein
MTEFMAALDQVKKYRELASAMADFVLIVVASAAVLGALHIVVNLLDVFYGYSLIDPASTGMLPFIGFAVLFSGLLIGVYWVQRRMNSVEMKQWESTLSEGTPGALKLLQETQWEKTFGDIRFAKLGFAFYGVVKVMAYWMLALFFFGILSGVIGNVLHLSFDPISFVVIPLVLVLVLSLKDLRYRYDQVGRLDSLLWELRWFDSEFRRADFKT